MKSFVFILALCLAGYWLYEYYDQNSSRLTALSHTQKGLVTTPIPTEPPAPSRAAAPSLDSIPIRGSQALTHAKIKETRADSILFLCDQGLVEIGYDRLPPEFRAYYAAAAPSPTPVVDPSGALVTPVPARVVHQPAPQRQRSAEEENAAQLGYLQRKAGLEAHQRDDLEIINRWYKQSTFDPAAISQAAFDATKADYDSTTAQLAQLEAAGP